MKGYYLTFAILAVVGTVVLAQPPMMPPPRPGCEKPPAKKGDECCKMPMLISETVMKECSTKYGPPIPPGGPCCIAECIMNTTKISDNGQMKADVAKKVLTEKADATWKPVIEKAIDTCEQQAKSNTGIFDPSMPAPPAYPPRPDGLKCDPKHGKLMICVHHQIFMNCPTMEKDAACTETKTIIEKCPEFLMLGMKKN